MSRMSLDNARLILKDRGYLVEGNSHKGYRVMYQGLPQTTLLKGRGIVAYAKEVLECEHDAITAIEHHIEDPEIRAEMRAVWEPGTVVVNVLTGERMVV